MNSVEDALSQFFWTQTEQKRAPPKPCSVQTFRVGHLERCLYDYITTARLAIVIVI